MPVVLLCCFVAAYGLALALEAMCLRADRPAFRVSAFALGFAGFAGHSAYLYLYASQLPLAAPRRWMLYLSWILVVFYLLSEFRQRRMPWGLIVLPVVLLLVAVGFGFDHDPAPKPPRNGGWGPVHAVLLLLASVGICVGFFASVTYLVQAYRLRTKAAPSGPGLKLLSLERLETMNRRSLLLSFPLLTGGVLAGAVAMLDSDLVGWADPRVLGTVALWFVFALLLYVRYARHVSGRQAAMMTVVAFLILLGCLALSHPAPAEGGR